MVTITLLLDAWNSDASPVRWNADLERVVTHGYAPVTMLRHKVGTGNIIRRLPLLRVPLEYFDLRSAETNCNC